MHNNKLNITLLISAFLIFAIAMIYGSYYIYKKNYNTTDLFSKYNKNLKSSLNEQIAYQNEIDSKIIDIVNNGGYTFDNPCILNNPYKISPLTSLIIFNTEVPSSVTISINNTTTINYEESINHIIPIVGLTSNAINTVKMIVNDNVKEITIEIPPFNEYIKDLNVKPYMGDNTNLMLINSSDANPYIRGFDHNNNLVYYLKFGNISKANYFKDRMQIVYNGEVINKESSGNIKLDIDYLGRIYSLNKNTEDITDGSYIDYSNSTYLITPFNLNDGYSKNYELTPISDTTSVTIPTIISTSSLLSSLKKAEDYKEEYNLGLNANFINYNFDTNMIKLLLVSKNNDNTYAYDLNYASIIKTDLKGEYGLFIIKEGKYYNLLTTISL